MNVSRACLVCVVALLFAAAPALADPPVVRYVLETGSSFQEGCFAPCMCPILAPIVLEGDFDLTRAGNSGGFRTLTLSNIDWNVSVLNYRLTGSGTLLQEIGGMRRQQ